METSCTQHHLRVLDLQTRVVVFFLFFVWFLSDVAFLSSRKSGTRVALKSVCVSEIQNLQWKPWRPSNMVATVTNMITFPCHIWLGTQLTSSASYCFQSPWGWLLCHQEQWPWGYIKCVLFVNKVSYIARFPCFPVSWTCTSRLHFIPPLSSCL